MSNSPVSLIDERERFNRLRLIRSENVGPVTYRQLMARFNTAEAALEALPSLARRGGRRRPLKLCPAADAEREIAAVDALGGQIVVLGEPSYPRLLSLVDDCPPVLSLFGNQELFRPPTLAIVGTRNASTNGRRLAERFARALGDAGYVIASGMARGIDTAAHRGGLDSGTIAVLAGGIDNIYPADNEPLYRALIERGAIISEMPFGTVPQARHFPRRNRIISGLSIATLVVEAQLKSGSLITARLAIDQGREVFSIPGSPLDPRARGCNDLIRKGAVLVETPEELISLLSTLPIATLAEPESPPYEAARTVTEESETVAKLRKRLWQAIGPAPVSIDDLARDLMANAGTISALLLELELAGKIERHPGGSVSSLVDEFDDLTDEPDLFD